MVVRNSSLGSLTGGVAARMALSTAKTSGMDRTPPLPVGRSLGVAQRRASLPEGTVCVAPLGSTAVAAGFHEGVKVISWDSLPAASAVGFAATCLTSLGSQSLAAGDSVGHVRVWHWRRGMLKLVYDVAVHTAAVRDLANSGDVLFTASADGFIKRLEVLEDFAPGDFSFSAGTAISAVAACKRAILVGCEDGHILEVHRKTCEVLQRFELGAQLNVIDVNEDDGRVLAAGGGRLAVWRLPLSSRDVGAAARARRSGAAIVSEVELCGKWTVPGIVSAMLLAGSQPEDVLVAGSRGIHRGGVALVGEPGLEENTSPKGISMLPAAAVVRMSSDIVLVAVLENLVADAKARAVGQKCSSPAPVAVFELELPKPLPESKSQSSAATSDTQVATTTNKDTGSLRVAGLTIAGLNIAERQDKVEDSNFDETPPLSDVQSKDIRPDSASQNNRMQNRSSLRTESRYWDPTEASRARSSTHDL